MRGMGDGGHRLLSSSAPGLPMHLLGFQRLRFVRVGREGGSCEREGEGGPPPLRPPRGPSDNIYSSVISPVWDFTPVSELFGLQPRRPLAAGRPCPPGPAVGAQWPTTVAPSQSHISDRRLLCRTRGGAQWSTTVAPSQSRISGRRLLHRVRRGGSVADYRCTEPVSHQ